MNYGLNVELNGHDTTNKDAEGQQEAARSS